jgi:two-component system CheB/CheR fusion protein
MIDKKINISLLTEKILLDNYAPPSVIIDKKNKALYFTGNTSQYLEPPTGEANLNILEMAKRGLKVNLEAAVKKARATNAIVETNNIDIKVNNHYQTINLIVKPILLKEKDLGVLMIIFETADRTKSIALQSESKPNASKKINPSSLEKELEITRNNLQTVIDELKNTNEDLQITNEEFQSSNEELQSTNEELETSREELQSVNEELITVNSELSTKIEQLSQANDDLDNLLSSIEIATVFLDRNLNIKRFTPAATKIFNLIPTDIDRPVTHLTGNLLYKGLSTDVIHALKTLATKAAEVQAIDGTWYNMRILPYRTSENIIEGVLVTFIDITDQKKNEYKLKKVNESLNMILERLPIVPYICLTIPKLNITYVGKNSEKVMGFLPEKFTKKTAFWFSRIHPSDKKKITTSFLNVEKKGTLEVPFRWKCSDGKYKNFVNYITYVISENKNENYIVGVWQEK